MSISNCILENFKKIRGVKAYNGFPQTCVETGIFMCKTHFIGRYWMFIFSG